jgi:hypothetical protein
MDVHYLMGIHIGCKALKTCLGGPTKNVPIRLSGEGEIEGRGWLRLEERTKLCGGKSPGNVWYQSWNLFESSGQKKDHKCFNHGQRVFETNNRISITS